ncbi:HP0729 family protein [Helicobacter salomonis]|uniref:HP0729 family protein n=1 Tax=Helicobacter salomonis TaxID=56878 RepID=UPI000CF13BB6|nr:HP0729 family protein [Helicobacter salomonis]
MSHLLILYNPYYNESVIKDHLAILKEDKKVAFGKLKPKSKNIVNQYTPMLEAIYAQTNPNHTLQLFLSDYANLFVAKVVGVETTLTQARAPEYYYKNDRIEVEHWFILADLRELVRNDFEEVRRHYLPNFTTPNYGSHTFAIYGSNYVYPLIIDMKNEIDHFDDGQLHYPNVFKEDEFIDTRKYLIQFVFGQQLTHAMHHMSLENMVYAELEYQHNKQDPLYDFGSVIAKYSKMLEQELFLFIQSVVARICIDHPEVLSVNYPLSHRNTCTLADLDKHRPTLFSYQILLTHKLTQYKDCFPHFHFTRMGELLNKFRKIRNDGVHGECPTTLEEACLARNIILGVDQPSLVKNLLIQRVQLANNAPSH